MAELELEVISTADSRGLTQAARDTDKLSGSTHKLGHEFQDAAHDSQALDKRITQLKASVKSLGSEFAKTQGPSVRKDLRAERGLLQELEKIRKEMQTIESVSVSLGGGVGGGAAAGGASGGFLGGGGRAAMIAKIVALASPLLVPLGAMVSGTILGAVGGGGIIGGVLLATKDQRVKSAFKQLGFEISRDLFDAGKVFAQPAMESVNIFRDAWRGIQPELREIFGDFAKGTGPLATGIGGFLREAVEGFRAVGRVAGPFMAQLGEDLPELSKDISDFFKQLAEGARGAQQGLHDLITVLGTTFQVTGFFLEGASRQWEQFRSKDFWKSLVPGLNIVNGLVLVGDTFNAVTFAADSMGNAAVMARNKVVDFLRGGYRDAKPVESFGLVQTAAEAAQEAIDELGQSLRDFMAPVLDAHQAADDFEAGLDNLTLSVKDNGKTMDIHTEKGRANRQALRDAAKAALELRDANIANKMPLAEANKKYLEQVASLERLAQKLGLNKQEIGKLIARMEEIPRNIVVDIIFNASAFVRNALQNAIGAFNRRQHGGPVFAGQSYLVGEDGPEILTMGGHRGMVTPMSRARRSSGGATVVEFVGNVDSAFATAFMNLVRGGQIQIRAA